MGAKFPDEKYKVKSYTTIDEAIRTLDALLSNRINNQLEVGENTEEQVLSHIDAREKDNQKFSAQIDDSERVTMRI